MEGLSIFHDSRLTASIMMVVGCGAIGNEVVKDLACLGVGKLILVDFDVVQEENLCHSPLFSREDIGELKVKVISRVINRLFPKTEVEAIVGDISHDVGLGLIKSCDVVLSCTDNRWARYALNRLCMRVNRPWVDGGITELEGSARVFRYGENCYACNLGPRALEDLYFRMPCSGQIRRSIASQSIPTTVLSSSVIGSVMVTEAVKLLYPEKIESGEVSSLCGKMFCYEAQNLSTKIVNFKAYDSSCPVHKVWEPVIRTDFTTSAKISSVLEYFQSQYSTQEVEICLRDDCFVDYIYHKQTNQGYQVMLPGRKVEEYVLKNEMFKGKDTDDFYQSEYTSIDMNFQYKFLNLKDLGIVEKDILMCLIGGREYYFEIG